MVQPQAARASARSTAPDTGLSAEDGGGEATPLYGLIDRVLALLECVGTADRPPNLSQISRQTGLPLSTVHRLLAALASRGVVERRERRYAPGPRMSWMTQGTPHAADGGPARSIRPYLAEHVNRTGLPVALAILDGQQVRYVEACSPRSHPAAAIYRAGVAPAVATAAGRLLLAFSYHVPYASMSGDGAPGSNSVARRLSLDEELRRIRREGLAIMSVNLWCGIVDIAAPVRGRGGRVVAAVSTAGSVGHIRPAAVAEQARRTADRLAGAVLGTGGAC